MIIAGLPNTGPIEGAAAELGLDVAGFAWCGVSAAEADLLMHG